MPECILKISEALSIGLHAMVYLANNLNNPKTVKDIAKQIKCSEAHLSKVLQTLHHAGLLHSNRGPKGGYVLAKKPEEITLLKIFEILNGPINENICLYEKPICKGNRCIFGNLIKDIVFIMKKYLSETTLEMVKDVF